jgi:hypothetical protein
MSETITASLTVSGGDTITVNLNTLARGPAGTGGGGSNSITSATTSDGTANLSLLNVTTATATVSGTLTANHIHGNLAGSVYAHVRAGEALLKGDPVYVSGFNNGTSTAEVSKADASNAAKMPAIGIMDADLAHNATGHMVITGTITDVNTAGYTVNAELYVASGGGMTATPPTARAQPVARVERVNLNNGAIIVKVNGLSASDATPSTLVRRTSEGTISVNGMIATGGIEFNGNDAEDSMTFNQGYYFYGAGAAAAHRTALGATATGVSLFTAATPAAARTTLGARTFTKPTDESRSSTTYTVDTHLKDIPLEAGKSYRIEFYIPAYVPTTEGGKVRLLLPLSSRVTVPNMNGGVSVTNWGNGAGGSVSTSTSGAPAGMRYFTLQAAAGHAQNRAIAGVAYTDVLASAGNLSLEWAQNAPGANATILLAGATLTVTEL